MKTFADHQQKTIWQGKMWIAGFALLLLLTYFMGISKTIQVYSEKKHYKTQLATFEQWQKSQPEMDVQQFSAKDAGAVQVALFSEITRLASELEVTVSNIIEPHAYAQSGMEVNLYEVECKGSFKALLTLVHQLESNFADGRMLGYEFDKRKDLKTRKTELFMRFWVQSLGEKSK